MRNKIRAFRTILAALYMHYFVRSDKRAKCPACGYRKKHAVQFIPVARQILHTCVYCKAEWMENPMIPAEKWMPGRVSIAQEKQAAAQESVSREPQVISRRQQQHG
jgi:C4-type Zn-finger protein